jgi:hypothetical protein
MILYFILGNKLLKKILNDAFGKNSNNKSKKDNKGKKTSKKAKNSFNLDKKIKNDKKKLMPNSKVKVFQKKKNKKPINAPPKNDKELKTKIIRNTNKTSIIKLKSNSSKKTINSDKKSIKKGSQISIKEGEKSLISNNSEVYNMNKKINDIVKNKGKSSFAKKIIKEKKNQKNNKEAKNSQIRESNNLIDEEINSLKYKDAIIIDKRSFWELYWSLLKKRHLILFAFYPVNDYNIMIVKASFFIVNFSLYMTTNGFFLVMHLCIKSLKIMENIISFMKFHK